MRGRILGFDQLSGQGQISGEDGQRFALVRSEWKQPRPPMAGEMVDFEAVDGTALSVYRVGGSAVAGDKNKIVAALLAFFLGILGVHKFYLGKTTAGVIMLLCGTIGWLLVLPGIVIAIIAFIEFIIYLIVSEDEFERKYVQGNQSWF